SSAVEHTRATYSLALLHFLFFLTATPPAEISTLSLHDALPISGGCRSIGFPGTGVISAGRGGRPRQTVLRNSRKEVPRNPLISGDRKSTRLNSSHDQISYAVFCLKKKKQKRHNVAKTADNLNTK